MTLNFQNKIVFPAPEHSYTPETAYGQVIYIPRNIKQRRLNMEHELKQKLDGSSASTIGKVLLEI